MDDHAFTDEECVVPEQLRESPSEPEQRSGIGQALSRAAAELGATGSVRPLSRMSVYASFGDVDDAVVRYRRAYLNLVTILRMCGMMEGGELYDKVASVASMIDGVLRGDVREECGRRYAGDLQRYVEDAFVDTAPDDVDMEVVDVEEDDDRGVDEVMVLISAIIALYAACGVFHFDDSYIDESTTDSHLYIWSRDTASLAAAAYAGEEGQLSFSPEKCREFWHWWVYQAVPEAWGAGPAGAAAGI